MIYLKPEEVAAYCVFSIDPVMLTQANQLVTTYIGDISKQQATNEQVLLNRNNKGKLQKVKEFIPLVSVDSVKTQCVTPFGISLDNTDASSVAIDPYGYLTYYMGLGINPLAYGRKVNSLLVTYTFGYDVIPEDIKVATGIIAQNIAKRGTFGATNITDFDVQLGFLNDSIITSDVIVVLNKYRGV